MTDAENGRVPSEDTLAKVVDENVETTEEMDPFVQLFEKNEPVDEATEESEIETENEAVEAVDAEAVQEDIEATKDEATEAESDAEPETSDVPAEEVAEDAEPEAETDAEPETSDVPAEEVAEDAELEAETDAEPETSDVPAEEVAEDAEPEAETDAEPETSDVPAEEVAEDAEGTAEDAISVEDAEVAEEADTPEAADMAEGAEAPEVADSADAAENAEAAEVQSAPEVAEIPEEAFADLASEEAAEEKAAVEEVKPVDEPKEAPAAEAAPTAPVVEEAPAPKEEPKSEPVREAVPPTGSPKPTVYPASVPPAAPPKKSHKGLWIGLIIALAAAIAIGCVLYIKYFVPKEIHVSASSLELNVGDTAKLEYTILPASADNLEVAWASSKPEIASIDEFGVVTALSGGECVIAVATGNGKTDVCSVKVTDPTQIQKESLNAVRNFINNQEVDREGTLKTYTIEEIDEKHSFLIASDETDLYLIYRSKDEMEEMGVEAQYSTYVKLSPENIETAEVKQEDILYVYGFPISMVGSGSMNLSSYQHGDQVPLSQTSSNVTGLDATDALHELTDKGSTICLDKFAELLVKEGFNFTLSEFGFMNYGALEAPAQEEQAEENTLTASEAQESWNTISDEDLISEAENAAASSASAAEETLNKQFFSSKPEGSEAMADTAASDELSAEGAEGESPEAESSGKVFDIPSVGPGFSFDIAKESLSTIRFAAVHI